MKVAIIGASSDRHKYGNKALRSYAANGFTVYPVNPNEAEVEGHPTFPTAADIPEKIDLALLYVPPSIGITVLESIAQAGIRDVYVNPGAGSPELIQHGQKLGLNMIEDCAILAINDSPSRY